MSKKEAEQTPELSKEGLAEDLARADLYGLLASLFFQPPDQILLDQIVASGKEANAQSGEAPLEGVWMNLVETAKNSKAAAWKAEYDSSFLGVGKPNVFLYGSFYMAGHLHEKPLLEIRRSLQQFGLEASDSISETQDHIAALFEVMRYLIAGEDVEVSNLTNQRVFFNDHIRPWFDDLCDAIDADQEIHLYKAVSALTREFLAVEGQSFDMI
ncbi:MAG: cytoplasmic chaperone TorD family protein [Oxalobacteraceae bacterium]|nr:cytoplasmic chaperone TorD family protein [Oxalobacteraceae bacterium]